MVDLTHEVLLVELLHGATLVLVVHFYFLNSIVLVDGRLEEVSLLDQCECVNVVEQFFK